MQSREPVVAGQFYPADRATCLAEIHKCLEAAVQPASLPEAIVAGIVPHAGWTFSGALAAMVFAAIKRRHEQVETFVVFGAAHGYFGTTPAIDDTPGWDTPLGTIAIDRALAGRLGAEGVAAADRKAHRREHSIEVQVPFIQHLFPDAQLLPIIVPPNETALALGEALAAMLPDTDRRIVAIGSTDLTHYGPRYHFTPMGTGSEGLQWAQDVNDRQFVDLALSLEPRRLLTESVESGNACGPGAAAAAIAVARARGVEKGHLLAQTTSNEVMQQKMGTASRDSVGYSAIVF